MKKRGNRIIQTTISIILLVALILFGGQCAQTQQTTAGPYVGGTKGIDIAFVPSAPATEFSQTDSQPVKVQLTNNGEYDVDAGQAQVQLYGLYMPSFGLSDSYQPLNSKLFGISKENTVPTMQELDAGTLNYKEQLTPEGQTFTLRAKVCYPYQSRTQISGCIGSTSQQQAGAEQVCSTNEEKLKAGFTSSSPVQITSVQEKPYGSQVSFSVKIENKGKGDVYDVTVPCNTLSNINKNIVEVEVNPADVTCRFIEGQQSNKGTVQLTSGTSGSSDQTVLFCTKPVTDTTAGNFEQNINFIINYKYIDRNSVNMLIRGS